MARQRRTRVDPKIYREFIGQIELQHIVLSRASVKRHRSPSPDVSWRYENKATKREYASAEDGFQATLHYLVRLLDDDHDDAFGEIRVAFTAAYSSERPMTEEIFDVFGELNLPLNVYPYVREFVQSATSRMGFPGLVLPTMKSH